MMLTQPRNPVIQSDERRRALAWWRRCLRDERAYWCRQARSQRIIDAWRAYRRATVPPRPVVRHIDKPCPDCGHRWTEVLEFPDGHVVFCLECGYRWQECLPIVRRQPGAFTPADNAHTTRISSRHWRP